MLRSSMSASKSDGVKCARWVLKAAASEEEGLEAGEGERWEDEEDDRAGERGKSMRASREKRISSSMSFRSWMRLAW